MTKSFDQLPNSLNMLGSRVERGATRVVKVVSTAIGATVVDTTKVDTGVARSNWRATLNAPASGTIPAYAPGNKLGSSETANANAAKSQQKQVISKFNAKKHTGVFIVNNVHYIGALNNGSPVHAPGLMVEQGLQSGKLALKSLRILDTK